MSNKKVIEKCDCYHETEEKFYASDYIRGYYAAKGWTLPSTKMKSVCWGTKECDECSCGGDRTKCDFYPKKE